MEIQEFWAAALPLLRGIDMAQLQPDLPLITPACDNPMAYALRLSPSGAAYVQLNLGLRKLHPALLLALRVDSFQLNPVESAAAILVSREATGMRSTPHVAVLCRQQVCITANGQPGLTALIDRIWAAAPFIGQDWVCTKFIPPDFHTAPPSVLASALAHCDVVGRRFYCLFTVTDREHPAVTLLGFLALLLGERLFDRLRSDYKFTLLAQESREADYLRAHWRATEVSPVPLSQLPALLQRSYGVQICPRCALSSDNVRFEGSHCLYCAAFQERISRAIEHPPS